MGSILSRFRKEKTTYQKLEILEDKIKKLEEFSCKTQEQKRKFVGNLLIISIGIYVIGCILYYFVFPPNWETRILYSIPLLLFPFAIFFAKQLVGWFFQRKVNKNAEQLSDLRQEKKKLLEHVMEKETYKVALEILGKFGDRSQVFLKASTPLDSTPKMLAKSTNMTPKSGLATPQQLRLQSANANISSLQQRLNTPLSIAPIPNPNRSISQFPTTSADRQHLVPTIQSKRTPYPIIDFNKKTVFDKMVDYLISDGVSNRFAMVCKECYRHNGMALQEDYEYSAFRCVFCNFLNPAKKLRPTAPKLQSELGTNTTNLMDRLNASSSDSDSDVEDKTDNNEKIEPEATKPNVEQVEETVPEAKEKPLIQKKLE